MGGRAGQSFSSWVRAGPSLFRFDQLARTRAWGTRGALVLGNFLITAFTTGSFACSYSVLQALWAEHETQAISLGNLRGLKPGDGSMTHPRFALLLIGGCGSCCAGRNLAPEWYTSTRRCPGHRSPRGCRQAPENTLASIRQAIKDGADWIEIDVQETLDGEVVVIHDSDFMKLAGVDLRVWDGTLEQLREIDVGSWFGPEFSTERVL